MLATVLESTVLAAAVYDPLAHRLWLEFRSGPVYCYSDVPPTVYQGMIEAPSKGAYFNGSIRGRFAYHLQADPNQ